jgi:hypothetical protein
MNTALVALTVLSMAAAPAGKPPPPPAGSPPPRGGGTTAPAPLTPPPPSSGSTSTGAAPAETKPSSFVVNMVETLYKKQQFEAADVVLGKALNSPETTRAEKVQLHVLEGMLRMESFQEPQARKAFQDALNLDREAKLPDFAPPATRQLFLDVKATLPLTPPPGSVATGPTTTTTPRTRREPRPPPGQGADAWLPWIPIAVGGVTLGTGGGFVVASRMVDGTLQSGAPEITSPEGLRSTVANGKLYQTAGYTMVGVGGAILIGGLVWKLAPEVAPMFTVNVAPSERGGVAAVISGSLP